MSTSSTTINRSARFWPAQCLEELLPVPPSVRPAAPLRATRIGPLVLVRPSVYPSALRPGLLVSESAGAVRALGLAGAGWVHTLAWAEAWRSVDLPRPRCAVWVPLPRHGVRSLLWGLLASAAHQSRRSSCL